MHKRTQRFLSLLATALIIIIVLSFVSTKISLGPITEAQHHFYSFFSGIQNTFVNYEEAQNLKDENKRLQEEINELTVKNAELQLYAIENQKLRDILNFTESNVQKSQVAKVIGRNIERQNTLLLDKGVRDNVQKGDPVIVGQGILVGTIIEARPSVSTVLLLTDSQQRVAVSTPQIESSIGVAQGDFGLSLIIKLIPQHISIEAGDTVITSGLQEGIPSGLVLGSINRIMSNENELFKTATINPQVDYDSITLVSVIGL